MPGERPSTALPRRTPLGERHRALGARMAPFAGFEMPIQYSGLVDEHRAVRSAAGLFDVSHMGEFFLGGRQAGALLDELTPSNISVLPAGRAQYTALTTERGTFVDDVLVYRLAEDGFLVVVNAANIAKDRTWIESRRDGFDVRFEDRSDATALLALQGPLSKQILAPIVDGFDAQRLKYYRVSKGRVAGRDALVSRTGYTGEIGFEIFVSPDDAPVVWDALLEHGRSGGLMPAGLGARDTLRLEAALPLYGNDIDETTDVLEAGLEFIIDWDKPSYIGRDALLTARTRGPSRRRIGFTLADRGIARQGHTVWHGGEEVARVTSGSWSPTLETAIGMTYLPAGLAVAGEQVWIEVRQRRLAAQIVDLPFYRRSKRRPV